MSPLQFIKKLRLQEARQQMLNSHLDAVSAAIKVGYEVLPSLAASTAESLASRRYVISDVCVKK
jgi:AraC-like DNA-binding protein